MQVPDVLQEHRSGNDPSGVANEILEQLELFRQQLDLSPLTVGSPGQQIHLQVADPQESHFLRISIDVGMGKSLKATKAGESDFPTARVRDAILPVLASGKGDVLVTPQGKEELKKAILSALQQKVPEIDARDIYFTEFLVQR